MMMATTTAMTKTMTAVTKATTMTTTTMATATKAKTKTFAMKTTAATFDGKSYGNGRKPCRRIFKILVATLLRCCAVAVASWRRDNDGKNPVALLCCCSFGGVLKERNTCQREGRRR